MIDFTKYTAFLDFLTQTNTFLQLLFTLVLIIVVAVFALATLSWIHIFFHNAICTIFFLPKSMRIDPLKEHDEREKEKKRLTEEALKNIDIIDFFEL